MTDAIGSALTGLRSAQDHFNQATLRIAKGDIEADSIVDSKIAELDVKAQLVSLKAALETQETIIDLLA
jgi:hypothetical protein